jgi:acyl carrier protein
MPKTTTTTTFDAVAGVLKTQFQVEPGLIASDTTLHNLGLDSLSLMEFVFAIEDHFDLRIPEDRLDPRQSNLTLADLCAALDEGVAARAAQPVGA